RHDNHHEQRHHETSGNTVTVIVWTARRSSRPDSRSVTSAPSSTNAPLVSHHQPTKLRARTTGGRSASHCGQTARFGHGSPSCSSQSWHGPKSPQSSTAPCLHSVGNTRLPITTPSLLC